MATDATSLAERVERLEQIVMILAEALTGDSPVPSAAAIKMVLDGDLSPHVYERPSE